MNLKYLIGSLLLISSMVNGMDNPPKKSLPIPVNTKKRISNYLKERFSASSSSSSTSSEESKSCDSFDEINKDEKSFHGKKNVIKEFNNDQYLSYVEIKEKGNVDMEEYKKFFMNIVIPLKIFVYEACNLEKCSESQERELLVSYIQDMNIVNQLKEIDLEKLPDFHSKKQYKEVTELVMQNLKDFNYFSKNGKLQHKKKSSSIKLGSKRIKP